MKNKEDDHATNVSTPSTTKMGKQTLKDNSDNSASPIENQEPGEFNVKCGTCNRIIAMDLEDKSKVNDLLDQHQQGTECDEAIVSMVLPQEKKHCQKEQSEWDQIPAWFVKEAVTECSDQTKKEIAEKMDQAV